MPKLCSLFYLCTSFSLHNWFSFKIKPNLLFLCHSLWAQCSQWARKLWALYLLVTFLIYTAWKGSFSFPINITADLAPVAVVLVYTLHPSGEIVADSVRFQVDKCFKNKVMFLLFLACLEREQQAVFSLLSSYVTTVSFTWWSHSKYWCNLIIRNERTPKQNE